MLHCCFASLLTSSARRFLARTSVLPDHKTLARVQAKPCSSVQFFGSAAGPVHSLCFTLRGPYFAGAIVRR